MIASASLLDSLLPSHYLIIPTLVDVYDLEFRLVESRASLISHAQSVRTFRLNPPFSSGIMSWHSFKDHPFGNWREKIRKKFSKNVPPVIRPRPPPGNLPRPRLLSICEGTPVPYNDQDQSPIFSKLPFELRSAVYELVLGHRLIHLGRTNTLEADRGPNNELIGPDVVYRRYFCRAENDVDSWNHPCWYPTGNRRRPKDPEEKLLALLQVCRRM